MVRPLRRNRWERLKEVRTGDGRDLPQRLCREIECELRRLEHVLDQIAPAEEERDAAVANSDASGDRQRDQGTFRPATLSRASR